MKTKWQNTFKANAADLWSNMKPALKTDLDIQSPAELNALINDTSSKLYNFIDVQ